MEADSPQPSIKRLLHRLDHWFHPPADPQIASLFRIAVGLLVFVNFVATVPFVELWWGEHGVLPFKASKLLRDANAWTLFDWLPHTDAVLWSCWSIMVGQTVLLALGVLTRVQAACLFVWFITFSNRNIMILDGGDTVFRLMVFFLIFIPAASDRWSFDAWWRSRRGQGLPPVRDGWGMRLVQIQICLVLWTAGMEKLQGNMWWNGTAMYYVMHLDDFSLHYPLPEFARNSLLFSQVLTWASLVIEILAPLLIWFRETRRWALLSIVLLHLGIDYMMNLFLFQWIMLAGWLTHADQSDWEWLKALWARGKAKSLARGRPSQNKPKKA